MIIAREWMQMSLIPECKQKVDIEYSGENARASMQAIKSVNDGVGGRCGGGETSAKQCRRVHYIQLLSLE